MNSDKDRIVSDLQDSSSDVLVERQNVSKNRKAAQRRLKRYQEKIDFIQKYGDAFSVAEDQYLYGKDL